MEQVNRGGGFWFVSLAALFLAFASWINNSIVGRINTHLFHREVMAVPGWWLYTAVRTVATLLIVWAIVRFPKQQVVPLAARSNKEAGLFFEPLMGLRAMACMIVLMGHFFLIYFPYSTSAAPAVVQMLLDSSPWAGVWLFFTLSGYLMGKGFVRARYTLDEAGCRLFYRNRILRIGPIYYVSILVLSVYTCPQIFHWKHAWILFEMAIFDYRSLPINPNQILWSVSTEMQFYLLAPVMVLFLFYLKEKTGRGFLLVPLLFLCLGTALRMWIKSHKGNLQMFYLGYSPLVTNLDLFLAGISINLVPRIRVSVVVRQWLGPTLFAGSLGFYALVSWITFYKSNFHMDYEDIQARGQILCCLIACVLIYVAELCGRIEIRKSPVSWFLMGLQAMGTLTYCLYVFHPEVLLVNADLLPKVHSLDVSLHQFPLVMLETLLMASLFYFFIEKPFDRIKRVRGTALVDAP